MRFVYVFVPLGLKNETKQDEKIKYSIETPTTKALANCCQTNPDHMLQWGLGPETMSRFC